MKLGYHTYEIPKGKLGQNSKIQEELAELIDAEKQGVRIMVECELADIYGALKARAAREGLKMRDLKRMNRVTSRAFASGRRK